jgi:tripartite-type tricarboxylate transporter receptor subunit TctC
LPNVPTTTEAGLPDYKVSAWNAVFGPKALPKDVTDKLVASLDKALDDESTRKRLLELGSVLPDKQGRTPAALQQLVESEVSRWDPVLKAAMATEKAADAK